MGKVDQGSTMGTSGLDPKSRVLFRIKPSKRRLLAERELSGKADKQRGKITLPKLGRKEK